MPFAHLTLKAAATAALGAALAGSPSGRAEKDSVKVAADSAEARAARRGAADASGAAKKAAPRLGGTRTVGAKPTAAKPELGSRGLTGMDIVAEADWAPERPILAAPAYRRTVNGRLVADSVVVLKGARTMTLYYQGDSVATYYVALGRNPTGPKQRAGDGRTPEGVYRIDARIPKSRFHRALHISYPSAADRARAARRGVSAGGDIVIHGLPKSEAHFGDRHRAWDWTEGCIAVTNREIEEIYGAVRLGAVIDIRP